MSTLALLEKHIIINDNLDFDLKAAKSCMLLIYQSVSFSRVPTAGIEIIVKYKSHCLTRHGDNFFVGTGFGKLSTPLRVRLTSITGEQVETTINKIENDVSLPSGVQFKGINGGGE